jgi:DNA-binding transcriptional ArsR family regulator
MADTPAPPPGGWPPSYDPSEDLLLTPKRLRGLVHPIRIRLLWLLETDGPATASQLGRRIGQSSGVTSYHLRTLADLGFVDEDVERGNRRDRWWRTRYRSSGFTFRSPDDPGDPATVEAAGQYLRMVVAMHAERMASYVDSLSGRLDELAVLPWGLDEYAIEVTYEEARALRNEVAALIRRYRREPGQPPREGTTRATFQLQVLPDEPRSGDGP